MSNRNYSRSIVVCCPKCGNAINLRETVDITSELVLDDETKLESISAMNVYGVEHSRYACTACGIDMNNCDSVLYGVFSNLISLPYNVSTNSATGSLGGCIGSTTPNMADTPHAFTYVYPNMLFCNADQTVINGLIGVISDTVGSDTKYENIRMQINPIGTVAEGEDGNPVESLTHYQVMIFINDIHFTNSEEEYNAAVELFTEFMNLIAAPIEAFRIQEEERAAIIEAERLAAEEAAKAEAEKAESEEASTETDAESENVTEGETITEDTTEAETTIEDETVIEEETVTEAPIASADGEETTEG